MTVGHRSIFPYTHPEHDIVAVVRWIDGSAMNGFIERLLGAVRE
jgi:hypothetical protein